MTYMPDFWNIYRNRKLKNQRSANIKKRWCHRKKHDILMMNKLIEHLEDNDDVQNVWHNWENPTE